MKRKAKGFGTTLGFEKLEGRRLLAADFACSVMGAVEFEAPEVCQVAPAEYAENVEAVDPALADALGENLDESNVEPVDESPIDVTNDVSADLPTDDAAQLDVGLEDAKPDPRNLDLSDTMDGYFGSINADSPAEVLTFTATADGVANVVVSASFGDAEMQLTANSSDGTVIEMQSEGSGGFSLLSFDVAEGEFYELHVCSNDAQAEGQFQLTVGFEAFVDQHANEVGEDSTELEWNENQSDLSGKLESAGDIDTFKVTAPATGEVTLELNEMVDNDRIDLDVQVLDVDGNLIADGSTNEMLRISFDVIESEQFFIAVSAGEGQKGDYQFGMNLESDESSEIVDGSGEDTTSEDVTSEDVASEDVTGEDVTSEDVTSEDVTSEDVTSEDVTSEDVTSEDVTSEDVTTKDMTVDGTEEGLVDNETCDDTPINEAEAEPTTANAGEVETELVESDEADNQPADEAIGDETAIVDATDEQPLDEQPIDDPTIGFVECPVGNEDTSVVEASGPTDVAQADVNESDAELLEQDLSDGDLVDQASSENPIVVLPPVEVLPINVGDELDSKEGCEDDLLIAADELDSNLVAEDASVLLPVEDETDMEIVCTFGADSVDLFFAELGNDDGSGFESESDSGRRFASRFGGLGWRF